MKLLSVLAIAAAVALSAPACAHAADPAPRARPETVGMSSARLGEIDKVLNAEVARGAIPGAVVAVVRKGKLVYFKAFGYRDRAAGAAMTTDTIFDIASMTKPVTTVGALMLLEQGRITLDDPLSTYLPQFANQTVAVLDPTGQRLTGTVAPGRPVRIYDLMRHTSGVVYGARGASDLHKRYPQGSNTAVAALTRDAFIERLSSLPLIHQPGTVWDYGFGLELTGFVIETVSGQRLGAYLQERLFAPLGMVDTGFLLRPDQVARYARMLPNELGATGPEQVATPVLTEPMNYDCGGGCLGSTAGDYMRFARMLLGKGEVDGVRILGTKTVEHMTSDQLAPADDSRLIGGGLGGAGHAGYGFGLGVAVRKAAGGSGLMGSPGDFFWNGAYGTSWWAEPKEDLAVVFMAYAPPSSRNRYRAMINALVHQAIVD